MLESMLGDRLRLASGSDQVDVTAGENDTVTVELHDGSAGIAIVGSRYDVHSLIIEADRQLSRLADRWR